MRLSKEPRLMSFAVSPESKWGSPAFPKGQTRDAKARVSRAGTARRPASCRAILSLKRGSYVRDDYDVMNRSVR